MKFFESLLHTKSDEMPGDGAFTTFWTTVFAVISAYYWVEAQIYWALTFATLGLGLVASFFCFKAINKKLNQCIFIPTVTIGFLFSTVLLCLIYFVLVVPMAAVAAILEKFDKRSSRPLEDTGTWISDNQDAFDFEKLY